MKAIGFFLAVFLSMLAVFLVATGEIARLFSPAEEQPIRMSWNVGEVITRVQVFVQLVNKLSEATDAASIEVHLQSRKVRDLALFLRECLAEFDPSGFEQTGEVVVQRLELLSARRHVQPQNESTAHVSTRVIVTIEILDLLHGDIDRIAEVLGRLRRQRGFAPTM